MMNSQRRRKSAMFGNHAIFAAAAAATAILAVSSTAAAASSSTSTMNGQSQQQRMLRRATMMQQQQQQQHRQQQRLTIDTTAALDAVDAANNNDAATATADNTPATTTPEDEAAPEPSSTETTTTTTDAQTVFSTLNLPSEEPPALCSPEYKSTLCPQYCNTPYLANKCCIYAGQSASMLTIEFPHNLAIYSRQEWFQNCTGASLKFTPYQAQGEGAFRPLFEVGEGAYADATSSGVYDSYMTQAMAVNSFAEKVEDLSPRISSTPELAWTDILPTARKMGAYGKKQASMPFDLDFVTILLRDDLRAGYEEATGMKQPRTWEEFADYIEYWHGKDLNGDNIPDMGICSLNGAGPGGPQAMLMAIASSKLQYLGSNTGIWFDTEDPSAKPLFENEAFYQAADLTRRLWMSSIDDQPGGWVELHEDYWHNGRCAAYMWLTGSVALVLTKSPVRRCASYPQPCALEGPSEWANRTVLWEPLHEDGTYWEPRRVRSMGSAQVYDRSDGKMKSCTPEITPKAGEVNCPYLDSEEDERDGVWINRTPYYYSAYQHSSISIREDAPPQNKDLIWDFLVMANLEAAPVVAQDLGPTYLDPFRRSHLTPETRSLYDKAWTDQQYEDLRKEFYFAGSNPNSGLPLSIPGSEEYELSMEMLLWQFLLDIGTDCTSKNDCKCRKYSTPEDNCGYGWGSYPDTELWARSRESGGSLTREQFAARLKARWGDITKTNGGGRAQIDRYRATLGQDPLPEDDGWVIPLVIGLSSAIGAIILAIVGYWVYITYRDKRRLLKQHEQLMEATLNESILALHQLDYPLHLVRADEFISEGKLRRHEVLRNTHKLTVLDNLSDVDAFIGAGKHVIFFSHQWTSFTSADPSGIQYETMVSSVKQLAKTNGWNESLRDVFVWIDYSCIPQANPSTQNLAMRSLAAYASSSSYFIIVAPKCPHADLDNFCDLDTYQRRMWCRAEQVCHSMRHGTEGMYLSEGKDSLVPVQPDFFRESLHVFNGELTCCRLEHKGMAACDRQSLVIPLLGLFGELYQAARDAHEGTKGASPEALQSVDSFLKEIETHQETMFPRTFTRVMWRNNKRVEEEVLLFGELIDRMKARIDSGVGFDISEDNGTGTTASGSSFLQHGASNFLKHGVVHGGRRSSTGSGGSTGLKHGGVVFETAPRMGSATVTGMNSRNTAAATNGNGAMQEMATVGSNDQ